MRRVTARPLSSGGGYDECWQVDAFTAGAGK